MADAHDPARLKFETAMRECAPHAAVLEEGLGVLPRRFVADDAPFAQKLQRLERLGAVPSVQAWNMLREVRDTLAHD